jgi:hypothetical protein
MKTFFFLVTFYAINLFSFQNLPYPYSEIQVKPKLTHGWFVNQNQLKMIFKKHPIKTVVELGSWLGNSTIFIANLLPIDGKIYAVDHWLGSSEHQGRSDVVNLLPTLYEQFLSNIIHENLTDKVIPIKQTTVEAAYNLHISPDMVYVDASHDENSVYQDLTLWHAKLAINGILCGDDYTWESVKKAVNKFAKDNNLELKSLSAFWWFSPKK